jgi:hypothetical protein
MTDLLAALEAALADAIEQPIEKTRYNFSLLPSQKTLSVKDLPRNSAGVPSFPVLPSEKALMGIPPTSDSVSSPTLEKNKNTGPKTLYFVWKNGKNGEIECKNGGKLEEISYRREGGPTGKNGTLTISPEPPIPAVDSERKSFVPALVCCECGGGITGPVTTSWGGRPCHRACGETAYKAWRDAR